MAYGKHEVMPEGEYTVTVTFQHNSKLCVALMEARFKETLKRSGINETIVSSLRIAQVTETKRREVRREVIDIIRTEEAVYGA